MALHRGGLMQRSAVRVATLEEALHYGKTLPEGLLAPIAGGAGVVLDQALGTQHNTGATSIAATCGAAVSAGELVIAFGAGFGFNPAPASQTITDSAGNTYTPAASEVIQYTPNALISASNIATALTTSSTVTYTTGQSGDLGVGAASLTGCSPTAATSSY